MKIYKVYQIENKINGKKYVGVTKNTLNRRFSTHKSKALRGKSNLLFSKAILKYGPHNFTISLLEEINSDNILSIEMAEKKWIKSLNTIVPFGYNLSEGGFLPDSNCLQQQSKLPNKNGFVGVSRKGSAYRAKITKNCKTFYSTSFWGIKDAAIAYDLLAIKHYGIKAKLNFPENLNKYINNEITVFPKNKKHFKDRAKKTRSFYRGLTWSNYKWMVQFYYPSCYDKRKVYLGRFSNEIEAAKVYDKKCWSVFKDKNKLNFPDDFNLKEGT